MYQPPPPTPLSELNRDCIAALATVAVGTLIVAVLFGLPTH
jgi:hypothetical protein